MPKFQENTGFKLPGVGSKEIDTPGVFRKDQGVEDVGYCSNTEPHMLPKGSSPLLKSMIDQVVPEYYRTSYTRTNWPVKKGAKAETQTANPDEVKTTKTTKDEGKPGNVSQNVTVNVGGGQNKKDWSNEFNKFIKPSDKSNTTIPKDKGTSTNIDREKITTTESGGFSGQSAKNKLGRNLSQEETDWMNKEIKRLGGVQQYRDKYKIGKQTKKEVTKYYVNGKEVSKNAYENSASANKYKV